MSGGPCAARPERPRGDTPRAATNATVGLPGTGGFGWDTGRVNGALNSRVAVEQAKGWPAEQHGVSPDEAFVALRPHARNQGLRVSELARRLVTRDVDSDIVLPGPDQPTAPR